MAVDELLGLKGQKAVWWVGFEATCRMAGLCLALAMCVAADRW